MSTSVNRPTDVKQKEDDVNRKLQLYGIYAAFANGKVPSNKQIDIALNSALASRPLANPSGKLSEEGRSLVADLRDVIEKAKLLVLTKNEGNLIQDFIWQSTQITGGNATTPNARVDKATAQQHGNQALEGLRTLGTLILSNGQFRKLLSDAITLLRDMAGDAAQNAATKINPSQDQLNQIDRPAEDDTWHEVPSVGQMKGSASDMYNKNKPFGKKDVKEAAGDATQAAHPTGARDPEGLANLAARDQQQGNSSGVNAQGGAQTGVQSLADKARANVPQETQDNIKNTAEATRKQTRAYLQKKVPKDRREQTIWRLKKMVVEIQGHSDYQQAIETLLTLAETYGGHAQDLTQQGKGTVQGVLGENKNVLTSLKTIIERFANSTSMDDLIDSLNAIYKDAQNDPELKNWFKSVDAYIRKCLQQQGYILQPDSNNEGNRLYDQGQFLLRERYRDHTNRVIDETKFLATQFEQDPQNKAFGDAMNKLFLNLGNDENGKPVFKKHLVKDLSTIILPGLFESVRYVPIPRIEVSDAQVDAIVENLVVESDNLMPNQLEISSDNYFRWGRKNVSNKNKNKVMIAVSGIQMDLKDVSYYVKRKQGFPSLTDKGVMDIFMGGEGFGFKLEVETADKNDRQHFFKVNKVKVDIKNMKLKVKQSDHKLLFNVAKPLLLKVMRPALQKVIEKQIKDSFTKGDALAWEIKKEADLALEEAQNDPENIPNIYSRYVAAAQKKIAEGKKKTEEVVAKAPKANVAMTQNDSMFKDIKLPGGISTKATEYQDLAKTGDRWETPVFGLGSAKESTNIPKLNPVSRKPHGVTPAGLRDAPQHTGGAYNGIAAGGAGYQSGQIGGGGGYQGNQIHDSNYQAGQFNSGYQGVQSGGYQGSPVGGYGNQSLQPKTAGEVPSAPVFTA